MFQKHDPEAHVTDGHRGAEASHTDKTPPIRLETALLGLVVLLISVPIALLTTFLATPVWVFIERTTGVEAVGHSGSSEWCSVATYAFEARPTLQ